MRITQIGHSTILVEADGLRLLLDPYFGRHGNLAYRRTDPPAFDRDACRDVDAVLISHAHFDHVDRRYLRSLAPEVPVFAPHRSAWWIAFKCGHPVRGVTAWKEFQVGPARIVPVPARHLAPALGYVINVGDKNLYFAGDTYAGHFMAEIGARFEPDVCLMPVATYRLPMTMGNQGAIEAARMLHPRTIIPIHQSIEPRSPFMRRIENADSFRALARAERVAANIVSLVPGESFAW